MAHHLHIAGFELKPKADFVCKRQEAFREASNASAEYVLGN